MRFFRYAAAPFAFLLLAPVAAPRVEAATAAEARNELRELRARIDALQKKLQDAEASRTEAVDSLRASERAISDASRRLRELTEQSQDHNRQLDELRTRTHKGEEALRRQQALLATMLYRQYVDGRSAPLRLLLSGDDPNRVARTLHYLIYIGQARAEVIEALRANLSQLRTLADETARKASELTALAAEEAAQRRRLEEERAARSKVLARIARDIKKQQHEIGTLKRNENRLTRLIEELGRVVARKPSAPPRSRNERVPERSSGSGPFEQLKGRLKLPVRGELANRFGSPRPEGGVTWKGLFIAARAGDEVRAIAPGRVVFADWLRGFGNLLIIDHGSAYMSLYGNNETLYRRVGDVIRGGDPIAAVGNSGGNAVSGLYFELRHEGRPLDPLRWVDIE